MRTRLFAQNVCQVRKGRTAWAKETYGVLIPHRVHVCLFLLKKKATYLLDPHSLWIRKMNLLCSFLSAMSEKERVRRKVVRRSDSRWGASWVSSAWTYGFSQPRDPVLWDHEDRTEEERPTCHLERGQRAGDSLSSVCDTHRVRAMTSH